MIVYFIQQQLPPRWNYRAALLVVYAMFTALPISGQPFSKQYIMAFHTCDVAACMGPITHQVRLAESDDLTNWTLVPNFVPYQGSVPDVVIRGDVLYLYTPGRVKRYDNSNGIWDISPVNVTILDNLGNIVPYVDPSPMVDNEGRIVLFFLNPSNMPVGQDPASCSVFPCDKHFDSAIEILGSNGTQFVLQAGHRTTITLTGVGSPPSASDPDIFNDGTEYIMYISQGQNTLAYHSTNLHGSYVPFSGLPNNGTLTNQGGIPSGIFLAGNQTYHSFVHSNGNPTVIRHAAHANFLTQPPFSTVLSGNLLGLGNTVHTESPGICRNTWLSCAFQPTITGDIIVCSDNTTLYLYNIEAIINSSYAWTVVGGTIITGQNTPQIAVLWDEDIVGTVNIVQTIW